jgi:flagellar basal-body rod protein FlgB
MAEGTGVIHYLETALRASGMRQSLIANNLANLHTPGFRRGELRFERVLATAIEEGRPVDFDALRDTRVEPRTTPVNKHGSDVSLDREIGDLVTNTTLYKAYVRLLNRHYQKLNLATQTT